jgi:hypothetical protein
MTRSETRPDLALVKDLLAAQPPAGLREVVRAIMQEVLEAEMTETLGAAKGERARRAPRLPRQLLPPQNSGCRRTATDASRPSCSSVLSARSRRS